jgi:hypothetical protein
MQPRLHDQRQVRAKEPAMSALSRRLFITRSSLTVAAAGLVSALPALPAAVNGAEAEAPEVDSAVADTESLTAPLIAHVKDLRTGEMALYSGEREIVLHNPALAARLFDAAR